MRSFLRLDLYLTYFSVGHKFLFDLKRGGGSLSDIGAVEVSCLKSLFDVVTLLVVS